MDGNLPEELMENILSLLPVKSLLRFTTISRSWDRIITSHSFIATHFRQANISPHKLFMISWYCKNSRGEKGKKGKLIRLENKKVHDLSMGLKYPPEISLGYVELCYCNGLILAHYGDNKGRMYVVWNPSTRVCVKFECPYEFFWKTNFYGLCYDPLVGDCKMVIWDMEKYAVFNCKSNHWTEVKDVNKFMNFLSRGKGNLGGGVPSSNGDYYWLGAGKIQAKQTTKIICFDSKEETFKELKLPIPQRFDHPITGYLTFSSAGNHLGVHRFLTSGAAHEWQIVETFELKMDGGQYYWKQLDMNLATTTPGAYRRMVHMESENEILFVGPSNHPHAHVDVFFLYNYEGQSFTEIERCSQFMPGSCRALVPFPENLFCFK